MVNIAILISGSLRTYNETLAPFIDLLPINYDVYMAISDKDDKFNTITYINNISRIKKIIVEKNICNNNYSLREQNILSQWYKLKKIFNEMNIHYDVVVRCRPDIKFNCSIEEFIKLCNNVVNNNYIYIPIGFNIYDNNLNIDISTCINDQCAIGTYDVMKIYCNYYDYISTLSSPLISEKSLYTYLSNNNIQIQRINLLYELILSTCFTFSICGDSGSGKTYISKLIQTILPYDKSLLFETDRYHKWERGNENYNKYTHLHPNANYLEKMSNDAYNLHLGNDIFTVDYDHNTGKFTKPQHIVPNKYIIYCGLHTLYDKKLNNLNDLRIFMNTDDNIKQKWKIDRDSIQRGHNIDKIINSINIRKNDFNTFIQPQIENANIIINYYDICDIKLKIIINNDIINKYIINKISNIGNINYINDKIHIMCYNNISFTLLNKYAKEEGYSYSELNDGYNGIIQYIMLLLIYT
jgi:uridine kinase